jgi:asparagine synthase (glutamine-hydrolysing)
VREVLLDRHSLARGLFNRAALEKLIASHFKGRTEQVEVIFRLLLLELWQRSTIDSAPHIPDAGAETLMARKPA